MNNEKKLISAMLVLVLSAALAAGCCTGCTQREKEQIKKSTEIVLWYYWDHSYQRKVLNDLADTFNSSQENIQVTIKYIPDADFRKELTLSIADGDMPDIALVDSADFQYFYKIYPFSDLTDRIPELNNYMSIALEPCTVEGRIMGLPCGLNCTALFYNKDILEEKGMEVPLDWEMLCQTAKGVSGTNVYGYGQSALQSEESLYSFLPMLWSMGGDVDAINSESSRRAFEILEELAKSGAMNKQSISLTGSDLAGQFAEGNVVMMANGMGMVDLIREQNPELDFGVTTIPQSGQAVSTTGGEIFGVMSERHEEEAIQFLQFVSEKERLISYIDALNMLAPREDIMLQQYQNDPLLRNFVEIFKTARPREFSEDWTPVSVVISEAIEEIIIGERDMNEVLDEAAEQIQAIREGTQ